MPRSEPPSTPQPDRGLDDGLDRLRERIRATQAAAERLASAAGASPYLAPPPTASQPQAPGPPPANGYAVPGVHAPGPARGELESLVGLLSGLLPAELGTQLTELVRELLLLVRALIDWAVQRLEGSSPEPVEVRDIPIA